MKKKIFKIFILYFLINNLFSQNESDILFKAYEANSKTQLNEFFKNWNNKIKPLTDNEFANLNDTVKECYKIFSIFYNPLKIMTRDTANNKVEMYGNVKYFVVQHELDIYFTDIILNPDTVSYTQEEIDSEIKENLREYYNDTIEVNRVFAEYKKTNNIVIKESYGPRYKEKFFLWRSKKLYQKVTDFQPETIFKNDRIVYLNEEYDSIVNSFLGSDHHSLGTGGIMNPAQAKGESKKKKHFLEDFIKIHHGHWGGWHVITFPQIDKVVFDEKMVFALVQFRIKYEGGTAVFKKENDSWKKLSLEMTWIE